MKILLINPSLIEADIGHYKQKTEKQRGVYPPLGLLSIAAVLEKAGHQVHVFDCDIEKNALAKIPELVDNFKPDLAGFYAMTWTLSQVNQLGSKIKLISPKTKLVVGGPGVTTMPQAALENTVFDFGVVGEGEKTILELVEALANNRNDFGQIKGLVYKQNNEIKVNQERELIKNLDEIPWPARHLIDLKKYFDVLTKHRYFATISATRGCPFHCTFCDRRNRMGYSWRARTPENIAQEIKQIKDQYKIKEFMFFDDNLIINNQWGLELCRALEPLNIIWECRNRVDLLNKELLRAMKQAGCYRIRLGFESGDDNILKILKKDISVSQSLQCAKLCQEIGMEIFGYFMLGVPSETGKTMKKTVELAMRIDPSFAVFSRAILIPGSELFDYAVSTNQIDRNYWVDFLKGKTSNPAPSFSFGGLPDNLIGQYVKLANKKFYFRISFALKKLFAIKNFNQLYRQIKIGFSLLFG